jgi:hypothetical protein
MANLPVRPNQTTPDPSMESLLHLVMPPKSMRPVTRVAEHAPGLVRKRPHCRSRRDLVPVNCLPGNAVYRAARDRGDRAQERTRGGPLVQTPCDLTDSARKLRRHSGYRLSYPGHNLARRRCQRPGCQRKKFRSRHPNQRQKMFRRLISGLGFGREFSQVLHHGIRVNLADRTELALEFAYALEFTLAFEFQFAFEFSLAFEFEFAFAEETADNVTDGSQPAFSFRFAFKFAFALEFKLAFELRFRFVLGPAGLTHS